MIHMTSVAETWTVTVEGMNALRPFERKIVRTLYVPVEGGEQTMENKYKERDKGHVTEGRYCKIVEFPPTQSVKTNYDSSDGRN
jgi:hypothetical protein